MANDVIKINEVEMAGQLTISSRRDKTEVKFFTEDKAIIDSLQTVLQRVSIDIPNFPVISGEYLVTRWEYAGGMYYVSFVNLPPNCHIENDDIPVGDTIAE